MLVATGIFVAMLILCTMNVYMCMNLVDYMLVSDDLYSCMSIKNPVNDNLSLNVFTS